MRKIPINTVADALRNRIRSNAASFPAAITFAELDEFWNLETATSALSLPCVVVEFVQVEIEDLPNRTMDLTMTYRLNYLARVPDSGGKRSSLLAGTRYLAELFSGGTSSNDPTADFDGGLTLGESNIDQAKVVPVLVGLNGSLAERNIGWGVVTVVVNLLSYPGAS